MVRERMYRGKNSTPIRIDAEQFELRTPGLLRISPDDGHSYGQPAISCDGALVAYISDRSGKGELWLQQIGGADAIQLTHLDDPVG
jgi:Tol biopolymer transport system component